MSGDLPEGLTNLDHLWSAEPDTSAEVPGGDVPNEPRGSAEAGGRLFLPGFEDGWSVAVKTTWDRDYCFAKNPGEDFYHLLMAGELYVEHDGGRYCLACAHRRGVISRNRLHWKRGV